MLEDEIRLGGLNTRTDTRAKWSHYVLQTFHNSIGEITQQVAQGWGFQWIIMRDHGLMGLRDNPVQFWKQTTRGKVGKGPKMIRKYDGLLIRAGSFLFLAKQIITRWTKSVQLSVETETAAMLWISAQHCLQHQMSYFSKNFNIFWPLKRPAVTTTFYLTQCSFVYWAVVWYSLLNVSTPAL